jgi:3-methyladenine DNA glycosylase/8-oxoguanine DNA glycosylase
MESRFASSLTRLTSFWQVHVRAPQSLLPIVERVRRVFDLGADPMQVRAVLERDPALAPVFEAFPGLRLPGAWDPFELAIRAILGQQVSVRGAVTLTGRLVSAFGEELNEAGPDGLTHLFPTPERLAEGGFDGGLACRARARRPYAKQRLGWPMEGSRS